MCNISQEKTCIGALRPATLLKRDSNTGEICEIFKNTYFEDHLQTTASALPKIYHMDLKNLKEPSIHIFV